MKFIMSPEELELFNNPDFDIINYINQKYPDEGSLLNLEEEIDKVEKTIKVLQEEIVVDIRNHAK